jgi:predicted Zn-dependent protease
VAFAQLDRPALARTLAQLVEGPEDIVDAFLERVEVVEVPGDGGPPGQRRWREEGLAVRLCRGEGSWLASRDRIDGPGLADAVRQVARVHPRAATPQVRVALEPWAAPERVAELEAFPRLVDRSLRERRVAFPYRLSVRRHRRDVQVLLPHLIPAAERETFYAFEVDLPWGRLGGLLETLGEEAAQGLAGRLAERFRAREAPPPPPAAVPVLLGPGAAAILLHEAVAHALEADTLARRGAPEAARGARLSPAPIDVLDDPAGAPAPFRRRGDDEGTSVRPRWLLRAGVVDHLLADRRWAARWPGLEAGAGRRASRHQAPGPRSSFLRLLPGESSVEELLAAAEGGLYFAEAERGALHAESGTFTLVFGCGRRIAGGAPREPVGACRLRGSVAELLGAVGGVGSRAVVAGAGWCAKGGQKLPVFASAPELLLARAEVGP